MAPAGHGEVGDLTVPNNAPTAGDSGEPMPLGVLVVMSVLMVGASLAVFPLLAEIQTEHGLSTASLGIVGGIAFLSSVVAQLVLAPFADRGHERSMLVASLVLTAFSLSAMALASDVATMSLARALEGIAFGIYLPVTRAIVTRNAGDSVGERLGRLSSAELIGVAAGPLLAAALAEATSVDVALYAFAVLALVTVPIGLRVPIPRLTDPDEPVIVDPASDSLDAAFPGLGAQLPPRRQPVLALGMLRERPVQIAVLLAVSIMVPVGAYDTLWSRFLTDLGASTTLIGLSLAAFALPYIVLATRAGRLSDRIGAVPATVLGMMITTVIMVIYGFMTSPWIITGFALIESTGQALAAPGSQAAMAHAAGEHRAAAGQGLAGAIGTFAAGVVATIAAPVYDAGGPAVLFSATAGFVSLVILTAWLLHRSTPSDPAGPMTVAGVPTTAV